MNNEWRFNRGRVIAEGMDIIIFQLQKGEVLHNKFDRLLSQLKVLDNRKDKGFSSLMLTIDGWNDVPEELYEIPQVRRYIGKLIRKIPHLLFYLNPSNQMPHQVLASLSDVEKYYGGPVSIPEYHKGKHQALIKLPEDLANLMIKAIKDHATKVSFEDTHKELLVIYKIIDGLKSN